MSNIKIEFGFGTDVAADGSSLDLMQRRLGQDIIRARAAELFGGCTLTSTLVGWLDPDTGYVVSEGGISLSVLAEDVLLAERVNALVACIKTELDQKAVAVTRYSVDFEIV